MFPVFMFYEAELDQVSKFKARSDLAFMINPWLDFMTYMMTLGTILLIICFFVLLLPVKSYCKVAITQLFYNHLEKKDQKEFSPPISVFLSCLYIWDGIRRFSNSFSSPSVPTTAHFREVFATTTTIYYTATSDWLLSKWRSRWSQRKCNLLLLLHFHFHFLNHCRLHHV